MRLVLLNELAAHHRRSCHRLARRLHGSDSACQYNKLLCQYFVAIIIIDLRELHIPLVFMRRSVCVCAPLYAVSYTR